MRTDLRMVVVSAAAALVVTACGNAAPKTEDTPATAQAAPAAAPSAPAAPASAANAKAMEDVLSRAEKLKGSVLTGVVPEVRTSVSEFLTAAGDEMSAMGMGNDAEWQKEVEEIRSSLVAMPNLPADQLEKMVPDLATKSRSLAEKHAKMMADMANGTMKM